MIPKVEIIGTGPLSSGSYLSGRFTQYERRQLLDQVWPLREWLIQTGIAFHLSLKRRRTIDPGMFKCQDVAIFSFFREEDAVWFRMKI